MRYTGLHPVATGLKDPTPKDSLVEPPWILFALNQSKIAVSSFSHCVSAGENKQVSFLTAIR